MKQIGIALLLLLGSACGKESAPKTEAVVDKAPTTDTAGDKTKADPEEAAAAPAPASIDYVSNDDKFSVKAVREPRISNQDISTALGPLKANMYTFNAEGAQGAIMIMVADMELKDLDEAGIKKALNDGRDGTVKKYGATISEDKEITLGGHSGRDFSFAASHPQAGEMVGRNRIFFRDGKIYQVMRVGSKGASDLATEADALIDSFKFTE